jgi:hypothetical protein
LRDSISNHALEEVTKVGFLACHSVDSTLFKGILFLLEGSFIGHYTDSMKNKNKVSKKTQKLINNLQEMVDQFAMAGDEFKSWRESWMEVIKVLQAGGSI